jgi:hypothetical protein
MTIAKDHARQRAYNQGFDAWNRSDISDKDTLCPYPVGGPSINAGLRQAWFDGLLDNRFSKYDHIPEADQRAPLKAPPKCRR